LGAAVWQAWGIERGSIDLGGRVVWGARPYVQINKGRILLIVPLDSAYEQFRDEVTAALRTTLAASSVSITHTDTDSPRIPSWAGFQFVDIARLEDNVFIAFHWHETSDQTFVYVADLGDFIDRDMSASVADAIISANLLELMGDGWYLQVPTTHIRGLTFIS